MPGIDGYSELSVIGRGATATVYRAKQDEFGRTVAIKLLHVDMADRRAQRRFAREKTINGQLSNHPNVVTVFDSGFVDGRSPYLVMEYFGHGSLAKRLSERGPFSIEQTLHVGVRIAGALESAHAAGVLHRDVKPQNVLLSRFGEPALADFGIATVLEMEQSLTAGLTPVHAAPELLENGEPSPSSDVYALASTLYTLLSGTPPFAGPQGEGVLAQLLRITTMELPAFARGDVPASLVTALRAATAKRPEDRTASAAEFGRALQAIQSELGLARTSLPLELPDEPVGGARAVAPAPAAATVLDDPTVMSGPQQPAAPTPPAGPPVVPTGPPSPQLPAPSPAASSPTAPSPAASSPAGAKAQRSPFAPPDDDETATPVPAEPDPAPESAVGAPASPAPIVPAAIVGPTAGAARDDGLEHTVGTVSDERTVLGRQRHPTRVEPDRRRPRLLVVGAASIVVALGAGGVAMLLGRGGGDPAATPTTIVSTVAAGAGGVVSSAAPEDSQAAETVADAVGPSAPDSAGVTSIAAVVDPAEMVPTNLHHWVSTDNTLWLEWDSPAEEQSTLFLWILYPDGEEVGPVPLRGSSRTYEVSEVADPTAPLCLLFTVPRIGVPDADPAESEAECINGAVRRVGDGSVVTEPPGTAPLQSAAP